MTLDEKFSFLLEDCARFIPDFKLSDYDELTLLDKTFLHELMYDAKDFAALASDWKRYSTYLKEDEHGIFNQ